MVWSPRMPSEIIDQGAPPSLCLPPAPSSSFQEENGFTAERQVGFWKAEPAPDQSGAEGVPLLSGKSTGIAMASWRAGHQDYGLRPYLCIQPESLFLDGDKLGLNEIHYEFSSSLSETFDKKLNLLSKNAPLGQSVNTINSNFEEDGPFESLEEMEAQTIGNLLPDDDDLLSGVLGDLGYVAPTNAQDDLDDDIFGCGGGMELEIDDIFSCKKTSDSVGRTISNDQQGSLNSLCASEHPHGEHPSRTLFVRNINSNVEDAELKTLFEQYGDIRTLYTACKHRGFVMISYYDIRSARNAMRALQNKPLRRRKLDIHFSIPKDNPSEKDTNQGTLVIFNLDSSVSNDDIRQMFGVYGEIKEIRETPHKRHHKFIEFYDVRAAEAALCALNRSDIAGKKIKLEPSRPGGARRCLMQQLYPELDLEESSGHGSPNNSLPGCYGTNPLGPITSSGLDNGTVQGPHSAGRAPSAHPFMETAFRGVSSNLLHTLSSPIRVASVDNHNNSPGHSELSQSLGQMKFGFQSMPNFLPHSLPDYHDSLPNGFYNPSTMSALYPRPADGIDTRHIHRVGPSSLNNHAFKRDAAFGVSRNENCPLHGHQYIWNNASTYQSRPPGPMMWSNSPAFVNSISSHPPPQAHGLPGAPSHMLNSVLPVPHHHVGSAPAMNPSFWDTRQAYPDDPVEAHAFHPGSLGSMGLSGNSPMHRLELASRNIFPHASGNCIDPAHVGGPSPRQRSHPFHGRNPMVPPGSFDTSNDGIRIRRSDLTANHADNKKHYELDIERIIHGEDTRTTLMIKNIPNKYTSKMLLSAIDEQNRGTYDFIYLPIDFKNKCNVGYAFINMIDPQQIIPFYQAFNGKKWEKFNSEKVATLAYARIQGKAALIAHFQNSSLMNEDKRCRPILFRSDGPNAGDQEPFPMGVNIRSRPGRSRTAGYEESHQGSPPSTSANEEGKYTGTRSSTSNKDSE